MSKEQNDARSVALGVNWYLTVEDYPDDHDLCGKTMDGQFVDVVFHTVEKTWSGMFDEHRTCQFTFRDDAKLAILEYVEKLAASAPRVPVEDSLTASRRSAKEYLEKNWLVLEAALNIRVSTLKELERDSGDVVGAHYRALREQVEEVWREFYDKVEGVEPREPDFPTVKG